MVKMLSNKILIFLFYVALLENYFGSASPPAYYEIIKENENSNTDVLNEHTDTKQINQNYNIDTEDEDEDVDEYAYDEEDECKPEASSCICKCAKNKSYNCDECIVLQEPNTATCTPGEIIKFYCPLCNCDKKGNHICEDCFHKRINIGKNLEDNKVYRKKRAADSFYDYLYNNDPLPLSTEQIRELQRQAYLQKRQDVIDKRREKQELAEQQAELARQNAEMRKELEYQKQLDEEQRALDAQQDYIDDYVYEDTNQQEQDEYFTKKSSDKKNRY